MFINRVAHSSRHRSVINERGWLMVAVGVQHSKGNKGRDKTLLNGGGCWDRDDDEDDY